MRDLELLTKIEDLKVKLVVSERANERTDKLKKYLEDNFDNYVQYTSGRMVVDVALDVIIKQEQEIEELKNKLKE